MATLPVWSSAGPRWGPRQSPPRSAAEGGSAKGPLRLHRSGHLRWDRPPPLSTMKSAPTLKFTPIEEPAPEESAHFMAPPPRFAQGPAARVTGLPRDHAGSGVRAKPPDAAGATLAGPQSSMGRQRLSTARSAPAARLSFRDRSDVHPGASDVGPAGYVPPSTLSSRGVRFGPRSRTARQPLPSLSLARSSSASLAGPASASASLSASGSLADWDREFEAASDAKMRRRLGPAAGKKGQPVPKLKREPRSLADWLESFGRPQKHSNFSYIQTRRAGVRRGR